MYCAISVLLYALTLAQSPPANFTTMLVFSPTSLANILDSLTYSIRPSLRCSEPARALYLLTRFACLTCDDTWLEDLMGGAVDRIERIVFVRAPSRAVPLPLTLHLRRHRQTMSPSRPFGFSTPPPSSISYAVTLTLRRFAISSTCSASSKASSALFLVCAVSLSSFIYLRYYSIYHSYRRAQDGPSPRRRPP